MSILAHYAIAILLSVAALAIPALVAWLTGAFRAPAHPRRIPFGPAAWYLALVLGISLFCFLTVQVLFVAGKQVISGTAATSQSVEKSLTTKDWAFLVTVPQICAFLVLLAGDYAVGGGVFLGELGVALRRLPRGIIYGAAGVLIVLPPVWFCQSFVEQFYERVHFEHPQEHELLLMMREAHSLWVRIVLIFGAVVVAPVAEEYLFRGHVQTLFRRLMMRWNKRSLVPPPVPSEVVQGESVLSYSVPAIPLVDDSPGIDLRAWIAILLASLLFAAVHPLWMWPAIFPLAVGLGYAYERTGNLWTCIFIHCTFNSVSTAIYLWVMH